MTKDENGLEPPKGFWFQRNEDQSLSLEEVVGQAIGAASMCWENPAGAGEFDSRRAAHIAKDVEDWVKVVYAPATASAPAEVGLPPIPLGGYRQ